MICGWVGSRTSPLASHGNRMPRFREHQLRRTIRLLRGDDPRDLLSPVAQRQRPSTTGCAPGPSDAAASRPTRRGSDWGAATGRLAIGSSEDESRPRPESALSAQMRPPAPRHQPLADASPSLPFGFRTHDRGPRPGTSGTEEPSVRSDDPAFVGYRDGDVCSVALGRDPDRRRLRRARALDSTLCSTCTMRPRSPSCASSCGRSISTVADAPPAPAPGPPGARPWAPVQTESRRHRTPGIADGDQPAHAVGLLDDAEKLARLSRAEFARRTERRRRSP